MNIAVANRNNKMISVNIEVYNTKRFVNCCTTDSIQTTYAKANDPEINPGVAYSHKIIKAYIDIEARKTFKISEMEAIVLCEKSIEQFMENKYENRKTFFIELISQSAYDLQYHYLIERS